MEYGVGTSSAMDGIHASVAAFDALFFEDAALDTAAADGIAVDVLQRQYEIRLERMAVVRRLEAQLSAVKTRDAAQSVELQHAMTPPEAPVHERTYAEMSAVEEIAGVLTVSSAAAGALVTQSRQLCSLPLVLDALSAGTISWQHARIIADETDELGPAGAASLVAHFLDPYAPNADRGAAAGDLVPSRFRARVRAWRERHHPESLEKRHAKSVADRRVEYSPDRNGTAWISACLPADQASAIWNKLTAIARGLQGPNESRTLTQLRPDILTNLLLSAGPALNPGRHNSPQITEDGTDGGADNPIGLAALALADGIATNTSTRSDQIEAVQYEGLGFGDVGHEDAGDEETAGGTGAASGTGYSDLANVPVPNAQVLVTVPVFSLLGLTDEPAVLDGHGPIPASMARRLVADGANSFYRVLVNPRDGAPLEIGRTKYRLTEAMKQALRLRDGKCTFPGCNNRSLDNEIDHLRAWQHGGLTGINNLAQLCPKHHRLKHNSRWAPTPATQNEPPGWTSPTGLHYKAEHPDWEPPVWPPGFPSGENSPWEQALVDLLTG